MQLQFLLNLLPFNFNLLCTSAPFLSHPFCRTTQSVVLNGKTDAFINKILAEWKSPGGIGIAVVRKDNQGVWNIETKGYGIATADGRKVTENTLFAMGSNSKLFTVVATGLLINNDTLSPRLSWTSKIGSIIPDWSLVDSTAAKQMTIIDAMSHRTGLPRHDHSYKWSDDVPGIIKKLKFQQPSSEFRDVYQYNNNMYALLSYLPSLLLPSKMAFTRYVKQHIFDPLGMTSTTYSYDVAASSGQLADGMARQGMNSSEDPFGGIPRALPYWSTRGGEDGNFISGAGGVISNAADMAIWLQTLLLNGVRPGTNESVIPTDVVQRAATGVSVGIGAATFPELSPAVYGGGQVRSTYRGHEVIEHGGSTTGFNTQITRLPFDDIGVAVLTNDNEYGSLIMEIIGRRILDEALGLEKIDWNSRMKTLLPTLSAPPATPRPVNASRPSMSFTSLTGTYDNGGYGRFELCLVSPNHPGASPSCKALTSNISTILPGAINPDIPTFIARWDNPWLSHLKIGHFNGDVFNMSSLTSVPTGNASEPYWIYEHSTAMDIGSRAEFVANGRHIGLGMSGIWGAGAGIPSPQGQTARDRAEVWFDKI